MISILVLFLSLVNRREFYVLSHGHMLICRRTERFAKRVNDFMAFTGVIVLGCVLGEKVREKRHEYGQSDGSRVKGYGAR
jgi:hypothetical protein